MSRRRIRHYRRNPVVSSTLLLVLGGLGLGAWLFTRKKSTTPSVPASDTDCSLGLSAFANQAKAVRGQMAVGCTGSPDPAGCNKNLNMAYQALEAQLTAWAKACGKPQASTPAGSESICLQGRSSIMQNLLVTASTLESQCKAAPGSKACTDLTGIEMGLGVLIPNWAAQCSKMNMPASPLPGA
jgi:hypothetical protein